MRVETATNVKINFGRVLESVVREPVLIQKSGRGVAVMLSLESYEALSNPKKKSGLFTMLNKMATGKRSKKDIDQSLQQTRDEW